MAETVNNIASLTDKEIEAFLDDLDRNKDGQIDFSEVDKKLIEVHAEIAPTARQHNLHYAGTGEDNAARTAFLRSMLGTDQDKIPRDEFAKTVRTWNIPTMERQKMSDKDGDDFMQRVGVWRRARAYWQVRGPNLVFLGLVVSLQIAFAVWMLVKYQTTPKYKAALGWGVVLAKTCAGALYPTLFFLTISMSRWLATFARHSYYISRFINWDLSQSFHIKMSIATLVFATLHAIGHLAGDFVHGSDPAHIDAMAELLHTEPQPRPYSWFIRSLPGWTGLTALSSFYIIGLLSMPQVRRYSYEIFQLGHLLMFVMLTMLCIHGTAQLLQWAMLGYFLAIPFLLVILERGHRFIVGFHRIPATAEVLDKQTVCITATIPPRRHFPYEAGQYVLLQVPAVSLFQWHPFTISACVDNRMQLHIKTGGDWTGRIRDLCGASGTADIKIGIDGPFGAPAQRFYNFDHSIIMGSGIGVTPFSGILTDLQARDDKAWRSEKLAAADSSSESGNETPTKPEQAVTSPPATATTPSTDATMTAATTPKSPVVNEKAKASPSGSGRYRRVDFHWIVKDRNALLWFADLLNQVTAAADPAHRRYDPDLDVNVHTHVTMKRRQIATHVYRHLLERHRTPASPVSPLTGLLNPTRFGRPDLERIMLDHYEDMARLMREGRAPADKFKVGVFFCGTPVIGMALSDLCRQMTLRGREDRTFIEYRFMMEVFT